MNDTYSTNPKESQRNSYAIISFVLALAPMILVVMILILLVLVSSGSILSGVGGGTWPLFIILLLIAMVISLISTILAVIFGICAIIKRKSLFSWVGIIIVAVEVLILISVI